MMATSILQKVLDIPNILSHLSEINMKGCIEYLTIKIITILIFYTFFFFEIDISNCKILGQEQNGEFILCWNLKGQGGYYTVVGLFFYTIKKIQVSKTYI